MFVLVFVIAYVPLIALVTWLVQMGCPTWSGRRLVLVCGLLLPILTLAAGGWFFFESLRIAHEAPPSEVDAGWGANMIGGLLIACGLIGAPVGFVTAFTVHRMMLVKANQSLRGD